MAILQFRRPENNKAGSETENLKDIWDEYTEEYLGEPVRSQSDYTKKIRRHRFVLTLRRVIIVLLLIAIAAVTVIWYRTRTFTEAVMSEAARINHIESANYREFSGRILMYSRDGASCIDTSGRTLWNITYEMQRPMISVAGSVAALADYNGSSVYIVSRDSILGTVRTNMPIRAVSASDSGEVAAVLSDTKVTWVYLFDSDGNEIAYFRTTMENTGYPVAVSISPNGEMVCISHLNMNNNAVKSSVAFYNFGIVGQNVVDNYVSGFDYNGEVVPEVRFMDDATAFAVSGSRLTFFKGREIPQNEAVIMINDRLMGVYSSSKYVGLLFADTTGTNLYRLEVYDQQGRQRSTVSFSMDFTGIRFSGDLLYINGLQECLILTVDGVQKFDGRFDRSVDVLIPSGRIAQMSAVCGDTIQKIQLK
ncbi:MAG: hypothetical protein IJ930_04465 [Lachnospiraceae bacterium]|nr:hypothetical protein [Lachnospiraceae bacterium]